MAQSVTKYAEIQQDEIEALKSIYMEDFVEKETKTGAWNVGLSSPVRIHQPRFSTSRGHTTLIIFHKSIHPILCAD